MDSRRLEREIARERRISGGGHYDIASPVRERRVSGRGEQGNYSLRRPPKLIIPKIFTKQRWATVYRFMCNRICKSKQAYMTRAKVMSSLRDKINQKLLTFKRTPSP